MLNVHLYFVKLFGGMILEGRTGLDITPYASAIRTHRSHPNVFIKLALGQRLAGNLLIQRMPLSVVKRSDGSCAAANWAYNVDGLMFAVMYAEYGMESRTDWWSPTQSTTRLIVAEDYRS
jgi:hypothetical protein